MKLIEKSKAPDDLKTPLGKHDRFRFRCHPGLECFNLCCRDLRLFLQPYDVARLRKNLGIESAEFIAEYTEPVRREGIYFPHLMLKMKNDKERTCPFLTDKGCRVYPDRPQTCRSFPVECALHFSDKGAKPKMVYFFKPPPFCLGQNEPVQWTVESWERDQNASLYNRMTARWALFLTEFLADPWGDEQMSGQKVQMAFMAAYDIDTFRKLACGRSFLSRFHVHPDIRLKMKRDDIALLRLSEAWIRMIAFGRPTPGVLSVSVE